MIYLILFLIITFEFKHFIADYYFQNISNLPTFKRSKGWEGVLALALHATDHAILTLAILTILTFLNLPFLGAFLILDFVSHFVIDGVKVKIEKFFPTLLGKKMLLLVDQSLHHLVYCYIIVQIVRAL